jgi:hypothetical protein
MGQLPVAAMEVVVLFQPFQVQVITMLAVAVVALIPRQAPEQQELGA